MPKKIIRKNKFRPSKKRFFKRKNNNKLRKKINYPTSTKVQTFGPGNFKINIEQQFVVDADAAGLYTANIAGYINDAREYQEYSSRFMFYRVEQIGITIFPNSDLKDLETGVGIDWYDMITDAQGFATWDSKKLIFNNNIRTKTFFFKIPNTMLEGLNSGPWNFKNYNKININLPGKVCLNIPGVARVQGRITARVAFKVPRPGFFDKNENNKKFKLTNEVRLINIPKSKFGEAVFQDQAYKTRSKIENYLEKKEEKRVNKNHTLAILKKAIQSISNIKNKYNIESVKTSKKNSNENKLNKQEDIKIENKNKSKSETKKKIKYGEDEDDYDLYMDKQGSFSIESDKEEVSLLSSISLNSSFSNPGSDNSQNKREYIKECWLSGGFYSLPRIKNSISLENQTIRDFINKICLQIEDAKPDNIHVFKEWAFIDLNGPNQGHKLNKAVLNIIGDSFLRFLRDKNSAKNEVMLKWSYLITDGNFERYNKFKKDIRTLEEYEIDDENLNF